MSDNNTITKEECAAVRDFALACYREGFKDSAISVGIGAGFVVICAATGVVVTIVKDKIKDKKEKRNK